MNSGTKTLKARYKKGVERESLDRLTLSLSVKEREEFEERSRAHNLSVSRLVVEAARSGLGMPSLLPNQATLTNAQVVAKQDQVMEELKSECEAWFLGAHRLYLSQKVEIQEAWVRRLTMGTNHSIIWELDAHDADEMGGFIETSHLIAERVKQTTSQQGRATGHVCHYAISISDNDKTNAVYEGMRQAYPSDEWFKMYKPVSIAACPESASLWGYSKLASIAFVKPKANVGIGSVCFKSLSSQPGRDAEELWRWLSNREALILGHHLRSFAKRVETDDDAAKQKQ